jgi:hypothetical protein
MGDVELTCCSWLYTRLDTRLAYTTQMSVDLSCGLVIMDITRTSNCIMMISMVRSPYMVCKYFGR